MPITTTPPAQDTLSQITIRYARPDDIPKLAAIENSGAHVFRSATTDLGWVADQPPMDPSLLQSMCLAQHLWVAIDSSQDGADEPVAFLGCTPKDGLSYIEEVSVHERWQRRGIARRLITAAEEQARTEGFTRVSLTTYRDLRWNGQFYTKIGFEEVEPRVAGDGHLKALEEQARYGHDIKRRCVMWKLL